MFQYVYILISLKDRNFYVGSTADLRQRLSEHNNGKVISTSSRRPLKLVCYEAYLTKTEALARENYLKMSDGRKELRIRLKVSLEKIDRGDNFLGEVAEWPKATHC